MRVLIDTNIVLDYLLERELFLEDAEALFDAIDSGQVIGYVTATTLTNIFYIARRQTRSNDNFHIKTMRKKQLDLSDYKQSMTQRSWIGQQPSYISKIKRHLNDRRRKLKPAKSGHKA